MNRIPLRCRCGLLTGSVDVTDRTGLRVICYCDDCQAYAAALDRRDILDAFGGTDIWQTFPARVELRLGREHLRCLRLSDRGMYRWYAGCCRTPIGNSLASPGLPFIGLVHAIMAHEEVSRDAALGPPTVRVQGRFASGGPPPGALESVSLGVILRTVGLLVRGVLSRGNRPSPFFIHGAPVVEPRVLSAAERAAVTPSSGASGGSTKVAS
ncbi:MAG: DUF6151 family protein [Myxococcales bacterium]